MQMAVIEFSRNVLGLENANSTEMDENTPYPVIDLMEEQKSITDKGGTMRLGAWACELKDNTIVKRVYKSDVIQERHRHRYEFNSEFKQQIEDAGMVATGFNPDTNLVEIIELPSHPWFVGVQYHPEYKSTVDNPHPLFVAFVKAALNRKKHKNSVKMAQN
jgi:CTP synthase